MNIDQYIHFHLYEQTDIKNQNCCVHVYRMYKKAKLRHLNILLIAH